MQNTETQKNQLNIKIEDKNKKTNPILPTICAMDAQSNKFLFT